MKIKLLLACYIIAVCTGVPIGTLSADDSPSWREFGDRWGATLNASKDRSSSVKRMHGRILRESATLYGTLELNAVHAKKNLTCYGSADLTKVNVQGVMTMYGPLAARGCTIKDLDVRCSDSSRDRKTVSIQECQVTHLLVQGKLNADKSTFTTVTVFGHELTLSGSTVHDIIVMNGSDNAHKKTVVRLNDTTVGGSILFAQKGGTVVCRGKSDVKGSIQGGTLIRK